MEKKKRAVRRPASPDEVPTGAELPGASGSSGVASLREEARAWGQVSRVAYGDVDKGLDAESELDKRRNKSGQ
jgi:hypothetical protein